MSGRSPQARLGVGFCGQGFDRGSPYRKTKAAASPMWSWIFAGVEGECFGGGPALVLGHGAAGFEIDRTDVTAGTPGHTVVLASADQFTDAYQTAIERATAIAPWYGGSDPRSGLRADMTVTPGPNGGAVFTTGSISYAATLSFNDNRSDTATILTNVIDGFWPIVLLAGDSWSALMISSAPRWTPSDAQQSEKSATLSPRLISQSQPRLGASFALSTGHFLDVLGGRGPKRRRLRKRAVE
jgi:hypothetical protein